MPPLLSRTDALGHSQALRDAGKDASSMEDVAQVVVQRLYNHMRDPSGARAAALVRLFKTQPLNALPQELQTFAREMKPSTPIHASTKCLTLLATAGDEPAWNSRLSSVGHQAIPLVSEEAVLRSPMIAALMRQFGVEVGAIVRPRTGPRSLRESKTYDLFHIEDAVGSASVPAQDEFVIPHKIRSVLGFGGALVSNDDLFAVILFLKVPVDAITLGHFRGLALDVQLAMLPFSDKDLFANG